MLVEVFSGSLERHLLRLLKSIQVHSSAVMWRPVTGFAIHASLQWWCALLAVQRRDLVLEEKKWWPKEQQSTGRALWSPRHSLWYCRYLAGWCQASHWTSLCLGCPIIHQPREEGTNLLWKDPFQPHTAKTTHGYGIVCDAQWGLMHAVLLP